MYYDINVKQVDYKVLDKYRVQCVWLKAMIK